MCTGSLDRQGAITVTGRAHSQRPAAFSFSTFSESGHGPRQPIMSKTCSSMVGSIKEWAVELDVGF